MGKDRCYELRLVRRDGKKIREQPNPIRETFDLDREREIELAVGQHFIPMAVIAEELTHWLTPWRKEWEFDFLWKYEVEIWRTDGHFKQPELTSISTRGYFN